MVERHYCHLRSAQKTLATGVTEAYEVGIALKSEGSPAWTQQSSYSGPALHLVPAEALNLALLCIIVIHGLSYSQTP